MYVCVFVVGMVTVIRPRGSFKMLLSQVVFCAFVSVCVHNLCVSAFVYAVCKRMMQMQHPICVCVCLYSCACKHTSRPVCTCVHLCTII